MFVFMANKGQSHIDAKHCMFLESYSVQASDRECENIKEAKKPFWQVNSIGLLVFLI